MTERPFRCPACADAPALRLLNPDLGFRFPLRRCDDCHGVWASSEAVTIARTHYHASHYVMVEGHGRQACRRCSALLAPGAGACEACGGTQALRCVQCAGPMAVVVVAGVTLDVCRACRAAFFDRGELGLIARAHHRAFQRKMAGPKASKVASGFGDVGGGDVALEALANGPDLVGVGFEGAHAAGGLAVEAVEHAAVGAEAAGGVMAAAGETAIEAAAAGAELAAGVAEAVLEFLGELFS